MSIGRLPRTGDGRIAGSYVYMLLCRDRDGPIYIKIGLSDSPLQRCAQLKTSCAVPPQYLFFVKTWSRDAAKKLEKDLLKATDYWRSTGEWLRLDFSEKMAFNECLHLVLAKNAKKGWPLRFERISVAALARLARQRKHAFLRRRDRAGKAYKAYIQDGGNLPP